VSWASVLRRVCVQGETSDTTRVGAIPVLIVGCRQGREAGGFLSHYRGSEGTHFCVVSGLLMMRMCVWISAVVVGGAQVGCGCVLFEKCIVDASIFISNQQFLLVCDLAENVLWCLHSVLAGVAFGLRAGGGCL